MRKTHILGVRLTEEDWKQLARLRERLERRLTVKASFTVPVSQARVIQEALDALEMRLNDLDRPRNPKRDAAKRGNMGAAG